MNPSKYQSFWPLPGGIENFSESLRKALTYISDNKPSKQQLTKWFVDTFPDVKKVGTVKSYIDTTLKHSGLVIVNKTEITLTEDGKKYLENPDNRLLFQTLDKNVLGFRETLRVLEKKTLDLDGLHKALVKELENYQVKWTSAHGQPYWRVSWLRSMGFVTVRGHEFCLTDDGRRLLAELEGAATEKPLELEVKPPREPLLEKPVNEICTELKKFEHASSEPDKYEEAITRAFDFLGFQAKHLGKPGETDIIATANLGEQKYTLILDGKTTASDKIIDRQINWAAIADHKEKHHADHVLLVGAGFAGGDLLERAKKFNVVLLETDTLIKLLKMHSTTPLALTDMRKVFKVSGPLRLEECSELQDRRKEYEKQLDLIPGILSKLQELQASGEPTTIGDLRWALDRKFDEKEILEGLYLLQRLSIVRKTEKEKYVAVMAPRIAAAKMKVLADAITSPLSKSVERAHGL